MSNTESAAEELLECAIALAKSGRNFELMDWATILHGYLQLTRLDPTNDIYRKNVEDAVASLLRAGIETSLMRSEATRLFTGTALATTL